MGEGDTGREYSADGVSAIYSVGDVAQQRHLGGSVSRICARMANALIAPPTVPLRAASAGRFKPKADDSHILQAPLGCGRNHNPKRMPGDLFSAGSQLRCVAGCRPNETSPDRLYTTKNKTPPMDRRL